MYEQIATALSYRGRHLNLELPAKAWVGHVPFGYWLIGAIKPRVIAELGTHSGASYFTFCDAIVEHGLDTKAFAVDTWQGDEQAGAYPESIYVETNKYNGDNFGDFSSLLRMTFDEALTSFEDSCIDILHIDGLHTYEAVSHDYQSWKTKLSDRACVLFHDICEIQPGFGVHKFWAEIKDRYRERCFEFRHSHGLGILFPNSPMAAKDFRDRFKINLEDAFKLFELIGDEIYFELNGRHSIKSNISFSLEQLLGALQSIGASNPKLLKQIGKHVFDQ